MEISVVNRVGYKLLALSSVLALFLGSVAASAHTGRRFQVEVVDGKLQAQGINSGESDGAPALRPYVNSIHAHWGNVTPDPGSGLEPFASSFLPDFGVPVDASFTHLKFHELSLKLLGVSKWVNPPIMPSEGTVPVLAPLDPSEVIRIESVNNDISSDALGELLLSVSIPQSGIDDIVLNYQIDGHPANQIHVLQWRLSATPADPLQSDLIEDSDPIFILLSPDGADAVEKLHHASLYLEEYLGIHSVGVPEPTTLTLAFLAISAWGCTKPRRSRCAKLGRNARLQEIEM